MEKEPSQSSKTREIQEALRNDKSVVGLWSRLQIVQGNTNRVIVTERKDGKAQQTMICPNGSVAEKPGTIKVRRIDLGHPIREVYFLPDNGGKEITLQLGEF